ncbi:pro-thyrotropin-releasing hormone [Pristis pectinata]|uniref:pro-thyrotropin-releasing hormone n=1 Tax=Pristis pectinata TaxID=685728 RepID=UPI00223D099D|nr:pro-thyrotropin-releasing hormone [Pristis pectinata]
MRSMWLLLLVALTLHDTSLVEGQRTAAEERPEGAADPLSEQLQRAEAALIRSMLMEMGQEGIANDADSPPAERIFKRQHPGKRLDEFEKRQHPGKREEEEEDGYRAEEKRQHPGRRGVDGWYSEENAALSKRQHPGKRFLLYDQSQQPVRGGWEAQTDSGENEALLPVRRHQETASTGSELSFPCDLQDPVTCSKASYLLELLGGKTEVKRQHPGKRFVSDEDMVTGNPESEKGEFSPTSVNKKLGRIWL